MGTILPRIRIDMVLNAVPIVDGSCTTLLAAVISAMVSDKVLLAALIDEADLLSPSKIPAVSIGCVFAHKFCYFFY